MDRKKILIVDDDLDQRRGLNVRLRASNYDTVFAADGLSAISVAQKERPDLIILDLGLPAGDGFTVIERLKAISALSVVPIVVVSARDPQINSDRALKAGADTFLQKPVDNRELLAAIRRALGEPSE